MGLGVEIYREVGWLPLYLGRLLKGSRRTCLLAKGHFSKGLDLFLACGGLTESVHARSLARKVVRHIHFTGRGLELAPAREAGRLEELLVILMFAARDRPEIDPRSKTKFGQNSSKLLLGWGKLSDPPTITAMCN